MYRETMYRDEIAVEQQECVMRLRTIPQLAIALAFCACGYTGKVSAAEQTPLRVTPSTVTLDSPESRQQLLVEITTSDGFQRDATRDSIFATSDSHIATVTHDGRVFPQAEGATTITVQVDDNQVTIPVTVMGLLQPRPVSFRHEVLPILTKAGCNSGGCHGKAEGQNGFKLSIFGFDPAMDHAALVKESRGRRVSLAAPESSLLLRKATASTPHGGGAKVEANGIWSRRLVRWIAEGAQLDDVDGPRIASIEVSPSQIVMRPNSQQQIQVTAIDSTGNRRCVTAEAEYQSNAESIAAANHEGLISVSDIPGEVAILVRFMGQVGVCNVTLPQQAAAIERPTPNNFIDEHIWDKLERLGVASSGLTSDAVFMRRVYLDAIGTLPTEAESRAFLDDDGADKRSRLVDQLLERNEYADYWAMRWADILRVDRAIVTPQGTVAMTRWLRRQFRENTPYDEFARQVVTAKGATTGESPAAFYQVHKDSEMLSRSISQVFLGVRIECAQCHQHPFEKWGQEDYFAFAGFFTGVSRKSAANVPLKIVSTGGEDMKHPRTNEAVPAAGLGAAPANFEGFTDRREFLAEWMTSPTNRYFSRMIVNRVWAHYMGRGLVEPIDDMRATNPATNEPLLDSLANQLVEKNFDLKALTRAILNSRAYQLTTQTNASNAMDEQNFSHASWKPLPAEVLLDAISQATQTPERFNGWPEGYRAIQVWDNRMPSYFFLIFGRPQRVTVCECERGNEPSIAQSLHLMNSPETVRKIRHRDGRAARLARSHLTPQQIVEQLYLVTLSRKPTKPETELMQQAFHESNDRRIAAEDILWTLLNTKEFIYNH